MDNRDHIIEVIDDNDFKKILCRKITKELPLWFGIPEANKHYEENMKDKICFGVKINNDYVGMLSLESPFANNANIFWLGILPKFHRCGIGKNLILKAMQYAKSRGFKTITVETLSEKQKDESYLKTYLFYQNVGFEPLFELKPYGPDNLMVYMIKCL